MSPWAQPTVTDDELHAIEHAITTAFSRRSTDGLNVLGMGELGLALGWPSEQPSAVVKRQAPGPGLADDLDRMRRFHAALTDAGATVLPTDIRTITNPDGTAVPYLIQPVVPAEALAENIIATNDPDPEHPVLESVRSTVLAVVRDDNRGGLSIDAQITNFAWTGQTVATIDTTPPLIWGPGEGPMHDVGNYLTAIPVPLRPVAAALTRKNGADYRSAHGVLLLTAVYLIRIGQRRWLDAAIECFNAGLDQPIDHASVEAKFAQVVKDLPTIKRLARIERAWCTRVRRRRYEFFITNSFTGEIY